MPLLAPLQGTYPANRFAKWSGKLFRVASPFRADPVITSLLTSPTWPREPSIPTANDDRTVPEPSGTTASFSESDKREPRNCLQRLHPRQSSPGSYSKASSARAIWTAEGENTADARHRKVRCLRARLFSLVPDLASPEPAGS